MSLASQIIKHARGDFSVLAGDDALTLPMLSIGARGVVSVTANILPDKVSGLIKAWESGDTARATEMHLELIEFHNAMFIETNPIPVKTAPCTDGVYERRIQASAVQNGYREQGKAGHGIKRKRLHIRRYSVIKAGVIGVGGRMGMLIARGIADASDMELTGALEIAGHRLIGEDAGLAIGRERCGCIVSDNPRIAFKNADIIIDFTFPEATMKMIAIASEIKKSMVIGTTGLSDEQKTELMGYASTVSLCFLSQYEHSA